MVSGVVGGGVIGIVFPQVTQRYVTPCCSVALT